MLFIQKNKTKPKTNHNLEVSQNRISPKQCNHPNEYACRINGCSVGATGEVYYCEKGVLQVWL